MYQRYINQLLINWSQKRIEGRLFCSAAPHYLRYFYEQRNDIHVIAAGSLLETLIDKRISFPQEFH